MMLCRAVYRRQTGRACCHTRSVDPTDDVPLPWKHGSIRAMAQPKLVIFSSSRFVVKKLENDLLAQSHITSFKPDASRM